MSLNSDIRVFDDPNDARIHMAALISDAYLHDARVRLVMRTKYLSLKILIAIAVYRCDEKGYPFMQLLSNAQL